MGRVKSSYFCSSINYASIPHLSIKELTKFPLCSIYSPFICSLCLEYPSLLHFTTFTDLILKGTQLKSYSFVKPFQTQS